MKYWPVIALSIVIASCNINMAYEQRISGKYYLIATDTKEQLHISRKLETGDYIGRIPERVQGYAVVNDTLIFARTTKGYYVLNTAHDDDFAEVKDVVIGPIDQATFNRDWSNKYTIRFTSPE
jgi:hypothetical protein